MRFMRTFKALAQWWLKRQAMARTRRELHALNDYHLKDLGLQRGAIDLLFR